MTAALIVLALWLALVVLVALVTRYDAVGFPRTEWGGTKAEQRHFHHRRLIPAQVACFALVYALGWLLTSSPWLALLPVASMGILWACATQDLGYWVWVFLLKLKSYEPGQFLGSQPYTKKTNLVLLIGWGGTAPKYVDTSIRLAGLVIYPVPLLILAGLL